MAVFLYLCLSHILSRCIFNFHAYINYIYSKGALEFCIINQCELRPISSSTFTAATAGTVVTIVGTIVVTTPCTIVSIVGRSRRHFLPLLPSSTSVAVITATAIPIASPIVLDIL
jgi:hypothetical protein